MMQSLDGDFESVSKAALWTIDELLIRCDDDVTLYTDFEKGNTKGNTFVLFQDPVVGWITKDPLKLGKRAQKLTFRYCHDQEPARVELQHCEGAGPMSLTAVKTALLVSRLFTECMVLFHDYPNAQPMSLDDLDFPIIGGWINLEDLRKNRHEDSIDLLWQQIKPSDPRSDFAVGRLHADEGQRLAGSGKKFASGDLIIIKRSHTTPTFGKVLTVEKKGMRVAVGLKTDGSLLMTKDVRTNHIASLILGHWAAKDTVEESERFAESLRYSNPRAKKKRKTNE